MASKKRTMDDMNRFIADDLRSCFFDGIQATKFYSINTRSSIKHPCCPHRVPASQWNLSGEGREVPLHLPGRERGLAMAAKTHELEIWISITKNLSPL